MSAKPTTRRRAELLVTGAAEVLTCAGPRGPAEERVGRLIGGAVAVDAGQVLAAGTEAEIRAQVDCESALIVDAGGGVVAPGFVDAHTHLVFGGSRVREYALRLTHTKAAVEALGVETGIMATVAMTRRESVDDLFAASHARLDDMLVHGTTTVESKSGYGLDTEAELKLLRVNRLLEESHKVDVVSTFMGAHDFPRDVARETYVDLVIDEMIPRVAEEGLAMFCDVFCDDGYYTVDQSRRILEVGAESGLAPKIHADQYSSLGGAGLAAELGAVSADHLNFTDDGDLRRLADAGVVAVLMPLIDFAVQHPRPIEARRWVDSGLDIALGTDLCPGGYAVSMPLAIQFACRWNGLSPQEALLAATTGSAKACGLTDRGAIAPGNVADLQVWDVESLEDLVYRIGHNPVRTVIKNGKVVV